MPFTAVLINRLGELTNITYSNLSDLKTKFIKKGSGNPSILHVWKDQNISILGFRNGPESNINKHELPPPIDTELFYGDFIAFSPKSNFTFEDYQRFYDDIFEFEDLDDTILEDEIMVEDDDYDYEDGFVVRDEDEEWEEIDD